MKKLMIAAAIVCAAALSQAATVNWTISNVKANGGTSPVKDWAVMAFYTEVGTGSKAITDAIASKTAGALAFEESDLVVSMSKGKVAAHDVVVSSITDTSKNYDFYYVVFNNTDATKATEYAMVSNLDVAYSGVDGKYATSGNFNGASWQNVPEPTSGLLLLLGVAGLALRRRRA